MVMRRNRFASGPRPRGGEWVANGVVYVGLYDGSGSSVYALNASTGTTLWSYTTGAPVYSSPTVANGMVYVGSNDGNLYAFGLK
jgi:outer membrane protein assembly factor BamB